LDAGENGSGLHGLKSNVNEGFGGKGETIEYKQQSAADEHAKGEPSE
jgi:hypothetical protein